MNKTYNLTLRKNELELLYGLIYDLAYREADAAKHLVDLIVEDEFRSDLAKQIKIEIESELRKG